MTYYDIIHKILHHYHVFSQNYEKCLLKIDPLDGYPTFIIEHYIKKSDNCHMFSVIELPELPNDDNIYPIELNDEGFELIHELITMERL